uniref:TBC1 domain family member 5 n=1 Tax=Chelydra serpentina TaxID=8475 RepID=A0A8C3TAZ8_CHESE
MYHSISETSHPLQTEEQEIGIDPLQGYLNKPEEGESHENGRTHHALDSDGTFISYSKEWEELFVNNNYLATIRLKGINGQLRSSRFRSVCWKLFLNVLPQDRSQWINKTSKLRTWYNKIKEIHITNPRKAGQQDLVINNPLSQDEGSLWNKFFQDKELRAMIEQDVTRTRWVRLLFGREFPLQDLLVVWDALFADSITLDLVDYIFVAMLLYIRDALISSNYQTCLGLLMHYPPIGDVHSLILRALFLRDPKKNPRPVTYQFQQNLDYYKARGADLMNKTRASAKVAPLNINKVSNSLLNFGRKLIAPAMASGSPAGPAISASSSSFPSAVMPIRGIVEPLQHQHLQAQQQQQRMMKSESMPVHLSKGQSSKDVSSSPSIESLSAGREYTGSPPLSASKKDFFFSTISRSRSHSKTMGRKESEEELETQISFLQGQLNDLEAMCKYCAKMMNTHLGNIQEVILQEHLEKEDEILVSLAGLKQIKDILKGSLRFNQSQLEAEENEQITIEDDHYCSSSQNKEMGNVSRSTDDYILVSKEEEGNKGAVSEHEQSLQAHKEAATKNEAPSRSSLVFSDPLMGSISASSSNLSSSPDDDSNNSKDSDFTIVSPLDI